MIHHGDCIEVLKTLESNSVDSIVTDPPYGLSFMGKKWDYDVPFKDMWIEALRVLKPGGHLLSFGGTRTYHRLAVNIEDAGFEIRDQLQWLFGSGFPKSHDVSKNIDKAAGAERERLAPKKHTNQDTRGNPISETGGRGTGLGQDKERLQLFDTAPATESAKQWSGWGTALKPANEPIVLARKPLEKGLTVAANVQKWGTGAINIDGSRIEVSSNDPNHRSIANKSTLGSTFGSKEEIKSVNVGASQLGAQGRWPANLIIDEAAAEMLGEPARFFYVAKASKRERNAGLEGMPKKEKKTLNNYVNPSEGRTAAKSGAPSQNFHPTIKPIRLMEYLIRLVTPPNGTVLDPFMGSGSTGVAAKNLGFKFIGIEMNEEYVEIARRRIG